MIDRTPGHFGRWISLPVLIVLGVLVAHSRLSGAESAVIIAPPTMDNSKVPGAPQIAVISAGCFWGVQGVFEHVRGVQSVVAGYAGGEKATAHYDAVSSGSTGHAESVRITFDPAAISYGQLLRIAFSVVHDPTQLNRQGPDAGTQYRSAVFFTDDAQKRIAVAYLAELERSHAFPRAIVTRVDPLKGFFPAEDYHQDYLVHNPTSPYIAIYDMPKVEALERVFPELYSRQPVLARAL